jgi:hypothetical protein
VDIRLSHIFIQLMDTTEYFDQRDPLKPPPAKSTLVVRLPRISSLIGEKSIQNYWRIEMNSLSVFHFLQTTEVVSSEKDYVDGMSVYCQKTHAIFILIPRFPCIRAIR